MLSELVANPYSSRLQAPHVVAEAVRHRNAAFTLFITTYDEIRAAVGYLRRKEGDADSIAPTLYSGRGPSKKKPVEPEPPVVTQPTSTNTNTPATHAIPLGDNGPFMT